jgi:Rieske Fe-S protein
VVGRGLILGVLVLIGAMAAIFVAGLVRTSTEDPVVSLENLEEREVIYLEEDQIFVVYNDGEPLALSEDAQHLPGDRVRFCLTSRMFEAAAHGEKFDIRGYYFDGPARRGLDRYPVDVVGDSVTIDIGQEIEGPVRGSGPPRKPEGDFCIPV